MICCCRRNVVYVGVNRNYEANVLCIGFLYEVGFDAWFWRILLSWCLYGLCIISICWRNKKLLVLHCFCKVFRGGVGLGGGWGKPREWYAGAIMFVSPCWWLLCLFIWFVYNFNILVKKEIIDFTLFLQGFWRRGGYGDGWEEPMEGGVGAKILVLSSC